MRLRLFTRLDVHILANILIGVLIGGVLVYGLTTHEQSRMAKQVVDLQVRTRILELEVDAMIHPAPVLP